VPPKSVADLANATERLASDRVVYQAMAGNARAAATRFAVADCAAKHAEAIRAVCR
jgi:hypothetical protein